MDTSIQNVAYSWGSCERARLLRKPHPAGLRLPRSIHGEVCRVQSPVLRLLVARPIASLRLRSWAPDLRSESPRLRGWALTSHKCQTSTPSFRVLGMIRSELSRERAVVPRAIKISQEAWPGH